MLRQVRGKKRGRERLMRRIAALALAAFVALLMITAGATAAKSETVNWTLRGASEWTLDPVTGIANVQVFDAQGSIEGVGTYSGTLTAGDYFTTDTCGPQCAPITGTITFVTQRGSFTTTVDSGGVVSVVQIGSGTYYYFSLDLSIVDGTKSYSHASGHFSLGYSSDLRNDAYAPCDPSPCTVEDGGTLTGTISRGASSS
jgi:hypothetical protein